MDKGAKAAQLSDHIRDYLAAWIQRDFPGRLVSVAQVQLSPNLQRATVWVECFNVDPKVLLKELKPKTAGYQHKLTQHMEKRVIPLIRFATGTPRASVSRIDELLKGE